MILEVIGDQNADCLKMLRYIFSSANSTPINASQSNSKQQFTHTPSTQYSYTINDANYQNSTEKRLIEPSKRISDIVPQYPPH